MAMENVKMFCYQCQETAKGSGCTQRGVCGKLPQTSLYMDLLLSVVRAVGTVANRLRESKVDIGTEPGEYICDSLFATITNANFSDGCIVARIKPGIVLRDNLIKIADKANIVLPDFPELKWQGDVNTYNSQGAIMGVLRTKDDDKRSLRELVMYGLKGMAAYYDHASRLGFNNKNIIDFMFYALDKISDNDVSTETLMDLVFETGKNGVETMALLDKANTSTYGNPEISKVYTGVGKHPGILISGHDLHDLEDLLKQTEGTGIDVYTHGEMLPAHYYPRLKRYSHLRGNYGNSWWRQRDEFEYFKGPIIFTTNCIVPPSPNASYSNRVFTLNSTGFSGWKHIFANKSGHKDFSEVINLAKQCAPPEEIEHNEIVGGFAHNQVIALADKIIDAIKSGAIRKFVVMAGCDGRMRNREYYTDFAKALPDDCVILTAGCAKYRYIKLPLGSINGIPRVLDAGQCNDSYSLVMIALKLKELLHIDDINKLPIYYNIAWYEQKAVIVLLSLLYLGIKNIHTGPTLPAFLSPNVAKILTEKFGLSSIATVEEDIAKL